MLHRPAQRHLKGVPKAFWEDMYGAARQVIMGDIKTLANRRATAISAFQRFGVTPEQICAKLEVAGIEDIGLEHLVTLKGCSPRSRTATRRPKKHLAPVLSRRSRKSGPTTRSAVCRQPARMARSDRQRQKTADDIIAMVSSKGTLTDEQKARIRGEQATAQERAA